MAWMDVTIEGFGRLYEEVLIVAGEQFFFEEYKCNGLVQFIICNGNYDNTYSKLMLRHYDI